MHRFYFDNINLTIGATYTLNKDIAAHIRALRLRTDEQIVIFNNTGFDYVATILSISKSTVDVVLVTMQRGQGNIENLSLYMAVIASDKMDFAIQKATELGVGVIVPTITQYTQNIKPEKVPSKLSHWNKIITSSCEQNSLSKIPILEPIVMFDNVRVQDDSLTIVLLTPNNLNDMVANNIAFKMLEDSHLSFKKINLIIGPEGGFSLSEIKALMGMGGYALFLGNRVDNLYLGLVLRSETAVIAGLSVVKTKFNMW